MSLMRRMLVVTAFLCATWGMQAWLSRPERAIARVPLAEMPSTLDGWASTDVPLDPHVVRVLGVNDYISRRYSRPGAAPVSLYIGFYDAQRNGQTIHSPLKCLPGNGWQPIDTGRVTLDVDDASGRSQRITINRYVAQKSLVRLVMLFWYQMRGDVVASEYAAKFYLLDGALRTGRTDGALVRITIPADRADRETDAAARAFVQRLYPRLSAYLPS